MARQLGTDISHWQGTRGMTLARWRALRTRGVKFAIIKASQGTGFTDSAFVVNVARARKQGMLVGAYHFLDRGNGAGQARHFVRVVKKANGGKLTGILLALDIEMALSTPKAQWPVAGDVTAFFVELEKIAPSVSKGIYTSGEMWSRVGKPRWPASADFLWLAVWPKGLRWNQLKARGLKMPVSNITGRFKAADIWQWGTLRAGSLRVDGNVFMGSMGELRTLWAAKKAKGGKKPPKGGGGGTGDGTGGGLLEDILDDIRGVLGGPKAFLDGITDLIGGTLRSTIKTLRNVISSLITGIVNQLKKLIKAAADAIGEQVRRIFDAVVSVVRSLKRGVERIIGGILERVGAVVGGVVDALGEQVRKVTDAAAEVVGKVADTVSGVADRIVDAARDALGPVGALVQDVIDRIGGTVGDILSRTQSTLQDMGDRASEGLRDGIQRAADFLAEMTRKISAGVGDLIEDIGPAVDALVDQVTGLPAALVDVAREIVEGIIPELQKAGQGATEFLSDPLGGILGAFFGEGADELLPRLDGIFQRIENNPKAPEELKRLTTPGIPPLIPIFGLVAVVVLPFILSSIASAVMGPATQLMVQEENRVLRPQLLGLADGINAVYRGERDVAWLLDIGAQLGYEDEDIKLVAETQRPLPTVGDILVWRHRKIVSDGQARAEFRRAGWDDKQIGRYIESSEVIPGLGDLVRFAVREAFPGQPAYQATQAGTPRGLIEQAGRLGLPDTAARSYWAAHWELPSTTQVFEMFHRGVITAAQMDTYLVVADVMPEWRDRLTEISYNPFTRVDIRRMFSAGILDEKGVERAYRDIGYSPKDAKRQLEFVLALEEQSSRGSAGRERDLTRADLIGAYDDGLIERSALIVALGQIGYDDDESALIVDRTDLKAERSRRGDVKADTIAAAVAGLISYAEAQDRLAAAELTTQEQAITLDTIERRREARLRAPTRADLFRFHKARLISGDELRGALAEMGYREPWLTRYVALAATKLSPIEEAVV